MFRKYAAVLEPGCWNWTGYTNRHGYGRYGDAGILTHRAVYQAFCGPIESHLQVCHRCDNPSCVRPSHLFIGTAKDNVHDMIAKERHIFGEKHWTKRANLKGEQAHYVTLTEEQVRMIRHRAQHAYRGLQSQMAREYGVTPQTICDILKRRSWTHV